MWPCPHRLYYWCKITTSLRNITKNNYWTTKRRTCKYYLRDGYCWPFLEFNPVAHQVPGSEYLLDLMGDSTKTKQFAIFGSVCGECCPLCTLKASLVDVEKKGISLLQQHRVTPQVPDTEQYNFELISEPREKYSDLLPGYTWNNCIQFPMLILVKLMVIAV